MNLSAPYAALANRMSAAVPAIQTVTRRLLPAASFPPEKQPALVVAETTVGTEGIPVRWSFGAVLIVYARAAADDQAPGDAQLALVSAIDQALRRQPGEPPADGGSPWTTLGGLVLSAQPEGVWSVEDDLDDPDQVSLTLRVVMSALEDP